jgi:hypothetical protein
MPMPTARRADRNQVLAFRLAGHHLVERRPKGKLVEVAGACGIRNTPPGSAPLALYARVAGLTLDAIEDALTEAKSLVEVLGMRSSPCLVPTPDVAVFTLGALPADEASIRKSLTNHLPALDKAGISATDALEQAAAAAEAELRDGMLTRGDLSAGMTKRLPEGLSAECRPCKSRHVQEMLFRLVGVQGVFVIARLGKQNLYVSTDEWLGRRPRGKRAQPNRGAARAALLRRYLRCYGPSTVQHFADWVGIGPADARRCWEQIAERLVEVKLDGRTAWLHPDDVAAFEQARTPSGVRLLPPYDAYLDQRDRATLVPDKAVQKRVWRILGNPGAVLADGHVAGLWRPQKKGKRLTLTIEAFGSLSRATRDEIDVEAALLAPLRGCTSAEVAYAE